MCNCACRAKPSQQSAIATIIQASSNESDVNKGPVHHKIQRQTYDDCTGYTSKGLQATFQGQHRRHKPFQSHGHACSHFFMHIARSEPLGTITHGPAASCITNHVPSWSPQDVGSQLAQQDVDSCHHELFDCCALSDLALTSDSANAFLCGAGVPLSIPVTVATLCDGKRRVDDNWQLSQSIC